MTLLCRVIFLREHLKYYSYFATSREGHNLDRCRTQIKLLTDMENHLDQMQEIIKKYM